MLVSKKLNDLEIAGAPFNKYILSNDIQIIAKVVNRFVDM
jgi:hypothetical protein